MEASDRVAKFWSNAQTYIMALTCLLLGIAAGYLLHSPAAAGSSVPANATEAAMSAPAKPATAGQQMPSAADMKRMADKQVAPLLADLQKHHKDADLLAKIAHSYLAAQQFQSAQQYYEQSVAINPRPDALNELAYIYCALGDVDKGIATLNRALRIDPKNPKVLFNLGLYEWRGKGDPKAAIPALQSSWK